MKLFDTQYDKKVVAIYPAYNKEAYKCDLNFLEETKTTNENIDINKIIEFFNKNKIEIEIKDVIDTVSLCNVIAQPVDNIKIEKIKKLEKNLAFYVGTENVLIDFDYNNKNIIMQIPKKNKNILSFKDTQVDNIRPLNLCLGIDAENNKITADLQELPHVLIAGTTGSGKSCLVNSLILQLANNYTTRELNLILIDPKKVEFTPFSKIPHLLTPVIEDIKECEQVLKIMVEEMEKRYILLQQAQCKNLSEFNKKSVVKIPYNVIIIDELADLFMQNKNIEDKLVRLAQKGRAAGICLILATQRPDATTLTGLLRANIPSRLALSVNNIYDSRIILDTAGAEKLLGKGDFLFKKIGENRIIRGQSPYVESNDIEKIVNFISGGVEKC